MAGWMLRRKLQQFTVKSMQVNYITNSRPWSGVGYRAQEIAKRLPEHGFELNTIFLDGENPSFKKWLGPLGSKSINWIRQAKQLGKNDKQVLTHLTAQNLSFMVAKNHPVVLTVHDLIELKDPQSKMAAWLNKYLYSGLEKADRIIAVSGFTKQQIVSQWPEAEKKITVIYNGVDDHFFPIEDFENSLAHHDLLRELNIPAEAKIVLYVGSEHPRKNLSVALEAFAKLPDKDAVFIKIGSAGLASGRKETKKKIAKLGLENRIRFVEQIKTEDLNFYYNLADAFIFPSKLEGFGLPPLQALAAGTPVVCSNAASLPEVVGNGYEHGPVAALTCSPDDVECFASHLSEVLINQKKAQELRALGLERTAMFSWDDSAAQVAAVYNEAYKK